jgi:hypothetical protein
VLPLYVTTDLESDLIWGLFGCNLDQVNVVPHGNGTFLDLVFANAPVFVSVACAASPLLKVDRHHRAYEIEIWVCCCEFEAMESRTQLYMFRMADNAAIVNVLDDVDWFGVFSGKRMDCYVDLFYEMLCSCFERHVPMRFSRGGRKLPWITGELSCLKNKKGAKRSKASEKRCLEDETIDDCEFEHLRREFLSFREDYQLMHGCLYDNYHVEIEEARKNDPRTFFGI